ncbi:MAG: hypothetical protein HFH24_06235 [Ruminococcus sp.]|nr:hypothetical protein [Ruminococcus sp.]
MKKKMMALLLAAGLAATMIVGCGGGDDSKSTDDAAKTEDTADAGEEAGDEDAAPAEDVEFELEGEYDPNSDYDKYTLTEYTIESAGATFVATVSAMEDGSKYEIHCNFYGDEQLVEVEADGDNYKVVADKTGFMETDSPLIIEQALEEDNWAAIK